MSELAKRIEKPLNKIDDVSNPMELFPNDDPLESSDDNELGKRVRELRVGRGLTIRELATKSSISVNTLSLIENGKTSPSVNTLRQIASALHYSITKFFENPKEEQDVIFTKANNRPYTTLQHATLEFLCPDLAGNMLDVVVISIPPYSTSGRIPIVHLGYELVYCLQGKILYSVEDDHYLLEKGDSLAFKAVKSHQWQNLDQETSQYLLVMATPSDDDTNILSAHHLGN
ncbi:MAG: XRE family transcriptional regulator [Anaerolineaceae bacterium]|nr:XRE family transcriptional regulator [Anaerolineaceae bacterium]